MAASAAAFFFLRQPSRPNTPRPVAKQRAAHRQYCDLPRRGPFLLACPRAPTASRIVAIRLICRAKAVLFLADKNLVVRATALGQKRRRLNATAAVSAIGHARLIPESG